MLSLTKADQLAVDFQNQLQGLPVNALAKQSDFMQREPRKVSPVHFLLGFFITALSTGNSLVSLATTIGLLACCTISKQAVDQRIKEPFLKFLELILAASLSKNLKRECQRLVSHTSTLFQRILVQDSTCIRLFCHLCLPADSTRRR